MQSLSPTTSIIECKGPMIFEIETFDASIYLREYEQPLGKCFRCIVGLDNNATKLAFGEILSGQSLDSQQICIIQRKQH